MDLHCLVVEDHPPMRAALTDLLRLGYPHARVAEAGSAARALERARRCPPRLVLLDVGLPDANGIDLIAALRAVAPAASVVVVSQHDAPAYVEQALRAGACAYVAKSRVTRDLVPALERVLGRACAA